VVASGDLDGRITVLQGFPLFSELTDDELRLIATQMETLTVDAQTQILTQNEDALAVYFLTQGAVKILVNDEMVAQVDTVQCFGEMSCLVPGTPASATVVTVTESLIFRISKEDFLEVINQIPRLWKTLFLQMNGRFKAVTMRLSEVLEHTPQGLVKVDRNGIITNEYSIQCTRYFGKDNLAGVPFAQLIHSANTEAQDLWRITYPMLFDESGTLTFGDIAELLDREISFKLDSGAIKEFIFSYYPCRSLSEKIEAIDIGIEDVTDARELERKNAQMLAEQAAMAKIYDNPESFLHLKTFIIQTLADSVRYIKRLQAGEILIESETTKDFLRKLHSLKGYAGVFALKPVQEAAHHLEDILKSKQPKQTFDPALLKNLVSALVTLKDTYIYTELIFKRIGESLRKRLLGVSFSQKEFFQLKDAANRGDTSEVLRIAYAVEKIDSLKLVTTWPDEAARIGALLDKEVTLTIEGDGGLIPKRIFENLNSVLIHLLRNALAHGLETRAQRIECGKPVQGTIRIRIDTDESDLRLEIQDDGRGIDFEHLTEQAAANEQLDSAAIEGFVSAGQPWKILFLSGFTTTPEVTDISGRGLGLSVVKAQVESCRGKIQVESVLGQGTTFKIKIPLEDS
jgi:signal transduction histidine kinase